MLRQGIYSGSLGLVRGGLVGILNEDCNEVEREKSRSETVLNQGRHGYWLWKRLGEVRVLSVSPKL